MREKPFSSLVPRGGIQVNDRIRLAATRRSSQEWYTSPHYEACRCWTEAVDVNSQVLRPAKVAAAQKEGYRSLES